MTIQSASRTTRLSESRRVVLEARGLTKLFAFRTRGWRSNEKVHAAEDISLALRAATVTAVVGESGSGKSTLSRMLAGITRPTSGTVLLDGSEQSYRQTASREYKRAVQLVLQDPFASLNPVHTVRYTLSRPLRIHFHLEGEQLESRMRELLSRVALEPPGTFLDKYPHELSGGQRQRVAIARALAVRPRVLLADEPVSMLDVSIRLGVLNLLADLRDREGLAILYVTHDIASARYLSDTILVMYAGQVVESAAATEITDSPRHPYTKLLLSAAPDPYRETDTWEGASGAPPSLVRPPSGCRFHPRCPFAMDICSSQAPPFFDVGPGHRAACWLHRKEDRRDATSP